MVARLGVPDAVSELELDRLSCALEGRTPPMRASRFVVGSAFDGRAAGGNLAVLCALVATNVQPSFDGCVVFLEDVGERPYRVDRMLTQLRASGALRGARGFVLGDFHDCDPGPDGRTVEHVLRERLEDLGAPIVVGAPFGHGARCAAFELSVHAQVDERCEISFTAAPSREAVSGARGASRA
jgi:muramoyltetrapeptide carboxypeptidase